jgi:hypothetical protein
LRAGIQRAKRNRDEARSNRRRIEEIWAKERELDQGPAVDLDIVTIAQSFV